ncbi:MarR family protein [Clostridiales bacterium CHKCI001]|nr:MarR family protein [Clostridiales bacterium CHKCI001]
MEKLITDQLAAFNQLYREIDEIYHLYAKRQGISDTALWLLYSLYENDAAYTQRELCSAWHYPPQTVNSALKSLEKQELIMLNSIPGNKKNKLVVLTEKGKEVTEKVISLLVLAEQRSFQGLKKEERETLLSLTQKYTELLRNEINEISKLS